MLMLKIIILIEENALLSLGNEEIQELRYTYVIISGCKMSHFSFPHSLTYRYFYYYASCHPFSFLLFFDINNIILPSDSADNHVNFYLTLTKSKSMNTLSFFFINIKAISFHFTSIE